MQMVHDSLMPEALSKFLREEALRPADPMFVTNLAEAEESKAVDPSTSRAEQILADIAAKRDRDAEAADRAAFAKRVAAEAAR